MYLLAKLIHQFVVLGALDGHLLQVRSVTFDVHTLSGLCKDGLLGIVWEHYYERLGGIALGGVRESSSLHLYRIESAHGSVGAVNVEFALVEIEQSALKFEVSAVGSARCERQNNENKDI